VRSSEIPVKRLLLSSLALLLVFGSVGQVFAAAFCPRASGHECCFAQTASHAHSSSSNHENMTVHHMHMDGMSMDGMAMADTSMDHGAMSHMTMGAAIADMSKPICPPVPNRPTVVNKLDQPLEACAHCVGHSGTANAPVSLVSVSGQSGKDFGFVLLPASRFLARPPVTIAQVELPGEHAPPATSVPKNILISVFLI
jgi:Cu/Ag efflux protein CusF